VNLAAELRDGERVYVPHRGEAEAPDVVAGGDDTGAGAGGRRGASSASTSTIGPTPAHPLDLNRADANDLDALPGVGPATAAAIVTFRTEHGPFHAVDDLRLVRGIGDAKLEQIRPLVRV
jgi:competence protein ComEA